MDMRKKNSLPTTERHILYILATKGFCSKKSKTHLNSLSSVLTLLREREQILDSEIIDESREIVGENDFECGNPLRFLRKAMIERAKHTSDYYFKSLWQGQDFYPIFVVEKEAIVRLFTDTLEPYRVRVVASRGNCSYPQMKELVSLFSDIQKTKIFLFSDCDYAGCADEYDLWRRAFRYTKKNPKVFVVERVALTQDQVLNVYKLNWIPLNPKDKNAKNFPNLKVSCELDALETKDLKDLIIKSVESCITNRQSWNTAKAREKWGKKAIQEFSKKLEVFIDKQKIYP